MYKIPVLCIIRLQEFEHQISERVILLFKWIVKITIITKKSNFCEFSTCFSLNNT